MGGIFVEQLKATWSWQTQIPKIQRSERTPIHQGRQLKWLLVTKLLKTVILYESYQSKNQTQPKPTREKKKEPSPMWLISELGNRLLKQSTGELELSKVICAFYRRQHRSGWKFCVGRGRQKGWGGEPEVLKKGVARFIGGRGRGRGGVRSTHTDGTFTFSSEIS
jgi:hypothetical protein